jgi:hypothetical protein
MVRSRPTRDGETGVRSYSFVAALLGVRRARRLRHHRNHDGRDAQAGHDRGVVPALPAGLDPAPIPIPFPSTYKPMPGRPTALVGATVLTGTGNGDCRTARCWCVTAGSRSSAPTCRCPPATVVDGAGKLGDAGPDRRPLAPGRLRHPGSRSRAHDDGNELTDPVTAQVWAEHSVWPQDPRLQHRPRRRGNHAADPARIRQSVRRPLGDCATFPPDTVQDMKMPGAPYGLKMACGENPKRVYGSKGRAPSTRMGNVAGYRAAWINAADYARKWDDYRAKIRQGREGRPAQARPATRHPGRRAQGRDPGPEPLLPRRRDGQMIDISRSSATGSPPSTTRWRPTRSPILARARGHLRRHLGQLVGRQDGDVYRRYRGERGDGRRGRRLRGHPVRRRHDLIQRLNQEAPWPSRPAAPRRHQITEAEAIKWITANPAKALGIAKQTGSLEPGKRADIVIVGRTIRSRSMPWPDRVYLDGRPSL